MKFEVKEIPIEKIENNTGQIDGLPKNPRTIKDERFKKLIQSIKADPEMLQLREIIVVEHGEKMVAICGNMRLDALKEIGNKTAHVKILPTSTPINKLKAYVIKDNIPYGENDLEILKAEWDFDELNDYGFEFPKIAPPSEPKDLSGMTTTEYKIEITCDSEDAQEQTYNDLTQQGYSCRILTL